MLACYNKTVTAASIWSRCYNFIITIYMHQCYKELAPSTEDIEVIYFVALCSEGMIMMTLRLCRHYVFFK